MSAWNDFSASDTLLGVDRYDECAVVRSGESLEAPCWRTIPLVASPFASIDTIVAWSNGTPWRWAFSRDASGSSRVSPRVLLLIGISTFPSYSSSGLTRRGIGAGEFDIGVGGGGSVSAGAGAGGVATGAGDNAATGIDYSMGTQISLDGSVGAARIGVIHGVSGRCQVTPRE